jgi:hypothetical protein
VRQGPPAFQRAEAFACTLEGAWGCEGARKVRAAGTRRGPAHRAVPHLAARRAVRPILPPVENRIPSVVSHLETAPGRPYKPKLEWEITVDLDVSTRVGFGCRSS